MHLANVRELASYATSDSEAMRPKKPGSRLSTPESLALDSILRLPDTEFVWAAYQAVLGRTPDPQGLANYVGQVLNGVDKTTILVELAVSEEGRGRRQDLVGLQEAVQKRNAGARSRWTRLLNRFGGSASSDRSLRLLENQLLVVERNLLLQAKQTAELQELVLHMLFEQGSAELRRVGGAQSEASRGNSVQLSNLARTFAELKLAASNRDG